MPLNKDPIPPPGPGKTELDKPGPHPCVESPASGEIYHPTYHEITGKGQLSRRSARFILPMLLQPLEIRSVLDVGCGAGDWLAVAQELGVRDLTGVEGPWAGVWFSNGASPTTEFELILQNLEERLSLNRTFDLTICLEVAEHLAASRGVGLVSDLCATSDLIIFSAAIPGQGGTRHVNERWQSHWANLFQRNGFSALDVIRPSIWANRLVTPPYQQNTILYAKERGAAQVSAQIELPTIGEGGLDIVHPHYYRKLVPSWLRPIVRKRRFRRIAACLGPSFARLVTEFFWRPEGSS